jgi:uncharacterized protein
MKQFIDIGTKIDLQDLLNSRMLIQANSGGGKSGVARVLIEETYGIIPFIMLDVEGEYYTLKEKYGDILIVGGHYSDLKISIKAAKLLPKEIIANRLSVVIDLSELQMHERVMYVKHFMEAMMDLPKEYWLSYLVFVEEAHKLCGQQDKHESGPAIKDLMTRGRKRGYCGVLITQRISKLHKDAAAECNNKFIGRTFLDIDMDRSGSELGLNNRKDIMMLRDLKQREFYCFGTSIEPHHVHHVLIKEAKTKFPKAGAIMEIKPEKPTAKLLASLSKLNELPQEAEKEAKDNIELRKEVNQLKHQLSQAQKQTKTGFSLQPSMNANQFEKLKSEKEQVRIQLKEYEKAVMHWKSIAQKQGKALTAIHVLSATIKQTGPIVKDVTNGSSNIKMISNIQRPVIKERPMVVSNGDGVLGKCSREIIKFLAQYSERDFSKEQVAIATGYSAGSGGFNNSISELNTKGFILRNNGRMQVNNDAMDEIINDVGTIDHRKYDIETYKENLGKCEREIYEKLLADPERWYPKEELANLTGYSADSGGFNNSISRLTTLALAERKTGHIRLNQELIEMI